MGHCVVVPLVDMADTGLLFGALESQMGLQGTLRHVTAHHVSTMSFQERVASTSEGTQKE